MTCSAKTASYGLVCMLGSIQFGFTLNFGGLPIEGLKKEYPEWDYEKDKQKISFFSNFASLFGSLGGFLIKALVHFTNGKKTICILNVINCILWLMYFLLTPKNLSVGIALRSLQGVITGAFACFTPIMMTNMSNDDTVGMLGCMNQFGVVFGMIVFSIIGAFTNFKIIAIVGAIVDAVHAGLVFILPNEKPEKDKKETIFQKKYMRGFFTVLMLMVFQQFCGINAILDNLTKIMSSTGIYINENLQAALASSSQLVSVLISSFNMDVIGRRKMWAFSSSLIVISQILYIICLVVVNVGWFQASSVFLYLLSFGQGLGPIPWFICHDIFPRSLRLDGQMFVTFVNMVCSFGVTYLFPVMKENMDEYVIMIIYMCITFCAIPFGSHFIPRKEDVDDINLTLI